MIRAASLCFRHAQADTDTLRDITLHIGKGQLCALIGVNGSGKSTLLTVLAGIFPPSAGSLAVAGHELPRESFRLRGKVALVPQDPDVYILGSLVEEDLLLGLDPDDSGAQGRALGFAGIFGLSGLLDRPVHTLSYGQKRKLCLASALAGKPDLLLLDEPFAGLDHPAATAMRDALTRNRAAGLTQVVVGHDLDLMADLADTFILLVDGRVDCAGDAAAVFPRLLNAGVRPPCWWFTGAKGPLWLRPASGANTPDLSAGDTAGKK